MVFSTDRNKLNQPQIKNALKEYVPVIILNDYKTYFFLIHINDGFT